MKIIKFTEDFLVDFFDTYSIEDDNLFDCLKDREGTIEESNKYFEGEDGMVLSIKLQMKDF